jgi:rhamnosyltransferase
MVEAKVAVLLAAFNGEEYIASQLASLFSQEGVDVHVIVRDDGSSDGTLDVVRAFAKRFPDQLNLTGPDNFEGGSAGRNFFALLQNPLVAEFDYIALCDQDDIWGPLKLASAVTKMQRSDAAAYSSNLIAFDSAKQKSWFITKSGEMQKFDHLFQSASAGCTYVLDRRAIAAVQTKLAKSAMPLPRILSHDYVIYAVCRSQGLAWVMDDDSHIFYRQHSSNAFSAMPGLKGLWQRWALASNGWFGENINCVAKMLQDDPEATAIYGRLRRLSLKDRVWLARHCGEFRRRRRDQIFLAIAILLGKL